MNFSNIQSLILTISGSLLLGLLLILTASGERALVYIKVKTRNRK